jgi:hypothetical protein
MRSVTLKSPWLKAIVLALASVAFLAGFMEVKASLELGTARERQTAGDPRGAMLHYFRSLNWYSPLGASQTAADELWALGNALEDRGETELAYLAYVRLRSALNASRSFYMPRRDLVDQSSRRIASYLAHEMPDAAKTPEGLATNEEFFYRLYTENPRMNEGWYLAAVGGFLLWTLGGGLAIFRFFKADRTLPAARRLYAARVPAVCFLVGYALWLAGMMMA